MAMAFPSVWGGYYRKNIADMAERPGIDAGDRRLLRLVRADLDAHRSFDQCAAQGFGQCPVRGASRCNERAREMVGVAVLQHDIGSAVDPRDAAVFG